MNSNGYPGAAKDIPGIDDEVIALVDAINSCEGIFTIDSCAGHGDRPISVYFMVENIDALAPLLYWFNACHSGEQWMVFARTDCGGELTTFRATSEPKIGEDAYFSADHLAACMKARQFVTSLRPTLGIPKGGGRR